MIIIALMAIMLMGSVVLSAAQSTFIIRNVYSINSHEPVEIFFFDTYTTEELYDLESSTLTITYTYFAPPSPCLSTCTVMQGNREWNFSGWAPPGINFTVELPGPYEVRPTPGSSN